MYLFFFLHLSLKANNTTAIVEEDIRQSIHTNHRPMNVHELDAS